MSQPPAPDRWGCPTASVEPGRSVWVPCVYTYLSVCVCVCVCVWPNWCVCLCPWRTGAGGSKCHVSAVCSETTLWVDSECVCVCACVCVDMVWGRGLWGRVGRHLTPPNQFTGVRGIWVFIRRGESSPLLAAFTCSMNKLLPQHGRKQPPATHNSTENILYSLEPLHTHSIMSFIHANKIYEDDSFGSSAPDFLFDFGDEFLLNNVQLLLYSDCNITTGCVCVCVCVNMLRNLNKICFPTIWSGKCWDWCGKSNHNKSQEEVLPHISNCHCNIKITHWARTTAQTSCYEQTKHNVQ